MDSLTFNVATIACVYTAWIPWAGKKPPADATEREIPVESNRSGRPKSIGAWTWAERERRTGWSVRGSLLAPSGAPVMYPVYSTRFPSRELVCSSVVAFQLHQNIIGTRSPNADSEICFYQRLPPNAPIEPVPLVDSCIYTVYIAEMSNVMAMQLSSSSPTLSHPHTSSKGCY